MMEHYAVYILTNHSKTLYVGVTNDLEKRIFAHKQGSIHGFTKKYRLTQLVHYELFADVREAIAREKQLKGWRRSKKIALIESTNPKWDDLAESFKVPCLR